MSIVAGSLIVGFVILATSAFAESRFQVNLSSEIRKLNDQDRSSQVTHRDLGWDNKLDFRYLFNHTTTKWSFEFHALNTLSVGDSVELQTQTITDSSHPSRPAEWDIANGTRHFVQLTLDRARVTYKSHPWRVTFGRFPVSWGHGIVFNPVDVFSAFPPTATSISREFRRGIDGVLVEALLPWQIELQALGVTRTSMIDHSVNSSTQALKLYCPVLGSEIELIVARHLSDQILASTFSLPLGQFLMRLDYARTCPDQGSCFGSGVVNFDTTTLLGDKLLYAFTEYYYNGVGVQSLDNGYNSLPAELSNRLSRGEIFALSQQLLALGTVVNWHTLWTQSTTLLLSLEDSSMLLQTYLTYSPTNHTQVSLGLGIPFSDTNEEFGPTDTGFDTAIGGSARLFFELSFAR